MTLNLAPMVDVMMCLIVFFLLASKLATEHFPVQLPWALSAKVVDQSALGDPVTITVRPAPEGGESAEYVMTDWDGRQIVERRLLPQDVEMRLKARAALARKANQTPRCVIRADREVMYQDVEVVLRACGLAGISKIVFPARMGEEPEDGA